MSSEIVQDRFIFQLFVDSEYSFQLRVVGEKTIKLPDVEIVNVTAACLG
jgi:GT2 family glycosyltransferase